MPPLPILRVRGSSLLPHNCITLSWVLLSAVLKAAWAELFFSPGASGFVENLVNFHFCFTVWMFREGFMSFG